MQHLQFRFNPKLVKISTNSLV